MPPRPRRTTSELATGGSPVRVSRFLSRVLRHDPGRIGLRLDPAGWADVDELRTRAGRTGVPLTPELLHTVVQRNDKQRFADEIGRRIRAQQGHSLPVDLGQPALHLPAVLFHGTAERFLAAIRREGLTARGRQHVHLSGDPVMATAVGRRHGRPVVLALDAEGLHAAGQVFHRSGTGEWLTAAVPPDRLRVLDDPEVCRP